MKLKINKKTVLDFLIGLFICAEQLREILAGVTSHPASLAAVLLYTILLVYFLIARIRLKDIVTMITPVLMVFLLLLGTWVLYPERHTFYADGLYKLWNIMFPTAGVYLLSVSLLEERVENYVTVFKIAAYIMFIYCAVESLEVIRNGVWTRGSIYNGQVVIIQADYNLNWGYEMLLPCIIFAGLYVLNRKKHYLVLTIVGLGEIFLYGSRGPLLVFFIYITLLYTYYLPHKNSKRSIFICLLIVLMAVLVNYGILQSWIVSLAEKFNIQSRTINKLLDGTITEDSNRSIIYLTVLFKIIESPIVGWGVYGDRYFMNNLVQGGSAYSHNVFLEMMMSFGILGLIFMAGILFFIVKSFAKSGDEKVRIILLICIGDCLPLMLSLTFWNQPMFWVLIAVLININRKYAHMH